MRTFIGSLLCVLLLPAVADGATLEVNNAPGCSDVLGNPYCTINAAIASASPGDTIQIAAGTHTAAISSFSKPLTFVGAGSGAGGTLITRSMAYTGSGPLSLNSLRIQGGGSNLAISGTGDFAGLTLLDAAFVGNGSGAHGVFVRRNGNVSDITVTNCTFVSHGQSGFLIQKGLSIVGTVDDVSFEGSTFSTNGEYGLRIDPHVTNLHVAASSITDNAIDGIVLLNADGVALNDLSITGNRNGILLIPLTAAESIANVSLSNVDVSNNTRFISGQYGSGLTLSRVLWRKK